MSKDELIIELKKINLSLSDEQLLQIEEFCHFLLTENQKYNLTAIRDYEEILLKHVYDSLTLSLSVDLLKYETLLDIGSGGGFPGIILKIAFPHLKITLLDANGKKTNFLELAKAKLQLSNLTIIKARAEDYINAKREKFDIVTARAVASLNILLELAVPYQKPSGYFIAMKSDIKDELKSASDACQILNCYISEIKEFTLPVEESKRTLVIVKKHGLTPKEYPRSYDKILKKPLKITQK